MWLLPIKYPLLTWLLNLHIFSAALQTLWALFLSLLCWLFYIFSIFKSYRDPVYCIYTHPWRNCNQAHGIKYHLGDDDCKIHSAIPELGLLLNISIWMSKGHVQFNMFEAKFFITLLLDTHTCAPLDFPILVDDSFIYLLNLKPWCHLRCSSKNTPFSGTWHVLVPLSKTPSLHLHRSLPLFLHISVQTLPPQRALFWWLF